MKSRVAVVGGGVVGLAIAIELASAHQKVTVIERSNDESGASFGNAGLVVPSHAIPLATRRALLDAVKWMASGRSPFGIKFRADLDLAAWLTRFVRVAARSSLADAARDLAMLSEQSLSLFSGLGGIQPDAIGYQQRGWLHVFSTREGYAHAARNVPLLRSAGVTVISLDGDEVAHEEPSLATTMSGGLLFPDDAQVDPRLLMKSLKAAALANNVKIRSGVQATGFSRASGRILAVETTAGPVVADYFVIAAGAYSTLLLRPIGIRVPVQPAKGYSLTFESPITLNHPLMLGNEHVVISKISPSEVRATGVLELSGADLTVQSRRVSAVGSAAERYLGPLAGLSTARVWAGLRALTPDGFPIVGPSKRYRNLIFATGHGTLGLTLAPITATIVSGVIGGATAPHRVRPSRFGA